MLPLKKNGRLMFFIAGAFWWASSANSARVGTSYEESVQVCYLQRQSCSAKEAKKAFNSGKDLLDLCNKFYSTVNQKSSAYEIWKKKESELCRLALGKVRRGLYLAQQAPSRELADSLRKCENALREYKSFFENNAVKNSEVKRHLKTIDVHVRKVARFRESLTRLNGSYEEPSFEVKKCSCKLPLQRKAHIDSASSKDKLKSRDGDSENIQRTSTPGRFSYRQLRAFDRFSDELLKGVDLVEGMAGGFSDIGNAVHLLVEDEQAQVFDVIGPSLSLLSWSSFKGFVSFCKSSFCEEDLKETVKDYLLLAGRALSEIARSDLEKQLKDLVLERFVGGESLVFESDEVLFEHIHEAIVPILGY